MWLRTWLGLRPPLRWPDAKRSQEAPYETVKPWPVSIAMASAPLVTFAISLRARAVSDNWTNTEQMLGATLRSIFRQSDRRFRVLVCGHDAPATPEIQDPRVEFIRALWEPPEPTANPAQRRRRGFADKTHKRFVMGRRLREVGGGYYMQVDADDLVHRALVAFALGTEHGCIIERGYALDLGSKKIAPVPGAWSVDFDRVCGSCAVVRYEPHEIGELDSLTMFDFGKAHQSLRGAHDEARKPLTPVPFRAAIYVVNTQQNISFMHQRNGSRGPGLLENIREKAILGRDELEQIDEAFGTALAADAAVVVHATAKEHVE